MYERLVTGSRFQNKERWKEVERERVGTRVFDFLLGIVIEYRF